MGTSDRDRAIEEALAGRAPAGHPDLVPVAAFAAELRDRAERVAARPSPAVASLLRGEKDLATYVELDTERTRRRPAAIWAAAAAVAVALGGVAVAQPWDSGGNTPTAASVTAPVETTSASSTSLAPSTTAERIVTPTVMSPPATAAVTVPPATVETRPTTEPPPPPTTAKTRPPETPKTTVPPPPPPAPTLEQAKARWRECATNGQQEGLTQDQIAARCGNEPNLDGYRAARTSWENCMKESPRSGPTASCGPEPDPAAFGFVPPIWPPQP